MCGRLPDPTLTTLSTTPPPLTIYILVKKKFGFIIAFPYHIFLKICFFLSPYSNLLISCIIILLSVVFISLLLFSFFQALSFSLLASTHLSLYKAYRYV
ncbi:hypothetical protein E2C01_026902 [Portunus trituberculatus]|uniref:Uncharacterized protein n=1 Tax=Portunus trituberculatus TaxID=210409 RepID=A0A5B7EJX4_PORTR|nr:hypothetical protein [Portunus trituberculatus]